ncbi:hypothetical protein PoMZ_11038 [Pyricularia oryzae]|uniref:FAD-binding FR-type domain-containing protein n=1 Tax=Pyricularia oryzae TaxID=318829 RepID=A0A4P7NJI3_PYROR|nr:hypothetical protein PoMZ_11038 [Pyricularia oryzae]
MVHAAFRIYTGAKNSAMLVHICTKVERKSSPFCSFIATCLQQVTKFQAQATKLPRHSSIEGAELTANPPVRLVASGGYAVGRTSESPSTFYLNSTGGSSHGAAGGSNAASHSTGQEIKFAARRLVNFEVATIYATFLASLIGIFIITHLAGRVIMRIQQSKSMPSFPRLISRPFTLLSRTFRNIALRKIPLFYSGGHGLLVTIYVVMNVVMCVIKVDFSSYGNVAARLGWLLTCNLALVVFLALKNTPLAFLTAYSHERLNNLHQLAGCVTFLMVVLHSILYTLVFTTSNRYEKLRAPEQIAGIVSSFAFLVLVATAITMRRFCYELFYATHIISFIIAIVAFALHRPQFKDVILYIIIAIAGAWAIDRLIRLGRMLTNSVNQSATVHPLPDGGTRIVLSKRPLGSQAGKHCFLWIPGIRALEAHPFTMISSDPVEFVAKSYDGFTRDLHKYAVANPGGRLWASVDGPYGTFSDPMQFDKIVLIAGGSGASFVFGLATNLLERMGPESTRSIELIWAVRTHENLLWYAEHLRTLYDHVNSPKCKVSLYVSRMPSSANSSNIEFSTRPQLGSDGEKVDGAPCSPDLERVLEGENPVAPQAAKQTTDDANNEKKDKIQEFQSAAQGDTETSDEDMNSSHNNTIVLQQQQKQQQNPATNAAQQQQRRQHGSYDAEARSYTSSASSTAPLRHTVTPGRPPAEVLIRSAVEATPADQRVLVVACGPDSLMRAARDTAASCIRPDGPGVELHCEQFGW